jgi:Periplasmic protease
MISKTIRILLLVGLLFTSTNGAYGQRTAIAREYLNSALSTIAEAALKSKSVNWNIVRSRCQTMAESASTPAQTYPAIIYALSELKDNHSFFERPDGSMESPPSNSSQFLNFKQVKGSRLMLTDTRDLVGYIVVEGHAGGKAASEAYAKNLRNTIASMRKRGCRKWILDLRNNVGGNMWPMLAGVGPIVGSGVLGYFVYPSHMQVPWYYERGEAGVENGLPLQPTKRSIVFSVSDTVVDDNNNPPIAVLIAKNTASSGEALAISLQGRPNTRFFGEPTAGLSSSNEERKLSDGAVLHLTTSVEADRLHRPYNAGITPDNLVRHPNLNVGGDDDLVIRRALRWLGSGRN